MYVNIYIYIYIYVFMHIYIYIYIYIYICLKLNCTQGYHLFWLPMGILLIININGALNTENMYCYHYCLTLTLRNNILVHTKISDNNIILQGISLYAFKNYDSSIGSFEGRV